jgi:hypothetical protein
VDLGSALNPAEAVRFVEALPLTAYAKIQTDLRLQEAQGRDHSVRGATQFLKDYFPELADCRATPAFDLDWEVSVMNIFAGDNVVASGCE